MNQARVDALASLKGQQRVHIRAWRLARRGSWDRETYWREIKRTARIIAAVTTKGNNAER